MNETGLKTRKRFKEIFGFSVMEVALESHMHPQTIYAASEEKAHANSIKRFEKAIEALRNKPRRDKLAG